jgi:hypothetical protein
MRNMSFMLTTEQVRQRTKTVTRRLRWMNAREGDVVQPVVKGQGLKKGERVEKIGGPIRFTKVTRETLDCMLIDLRYGEGEVKREGFRHLTASEFISMFCHHNGCQQWDSVTRIEFEYVDQPVGSQEQP